MTRSLSGRPGRRCASLVLIVGSAYAGPGMVRAQELPLPRASVWSPDWGLSDPAAVRDGQLALVQRAGGAGLTVNRLGDRVIVTPPATGVPRSLPFQGSDVFVVADFRRGNRNRLGGFFNVFQKLPSRGSAVLAPSPDGRFALRLDCWRAEAGFCGVWVHLFESRSPPDLRRLLDARGLAILSFWVRGRDGGEKLWVRLADERLEQRGDAVRVGALDDFLPSGRVESYWQQAVVPVASLPRALDRSALATFSLEATTRGSSQVFVSTLAWSRNEAALPELPTSLAQSPASKRDGLVPRHKATWIWHTDELLADPEGAGDLIAFLARDGFDRVFLQLPPHRIHAGLPAEIGIERDRIEPLLRAFNQAGLRVYALDGAPGYAMPPYDEGVLRTVRNVAEYNTTVDSEARFFGVRYDIEPYLLPGFGGVRREPILAALVDLAARMAAEARAADLRVGMDIPFWYDEPAARSWARMTVEFRGVRKPASHHLIDLLDDVAIMDYRTTAYGADGTVAHAEDEMAYAAARGRDVFVALETFALPDETLVEFEGAPERGIPTTLPEADFVLATSGGRAGSATDSVIFLYVPPRPSDGVDARAERIAAALGESGAQGHDVLRWPVRRRIAVPATKLSFHGMGSQRIQSVMEQTARELARYPSFAGFALHYAQTYRALVDPTAAPEDARR